ncbi:hypothetical protein [Peribacillus frigoritolerans]|uniref:hypothetical protein n=1 Tax=Peribacillus frigoritolerans TaxID=450367 RepID=UPI0039A2BA35
MTKEQLFDRILEEKIIIDPLIWLLKIEDKVEKTHEQYICSIAARNKNNIKVKILLEKYIEFWEIK